MTVRTYNALPYNAAAYLFGTALLPAGIGSSPDPDRSSSSRTGPDAGRATPLRNGPDPARAVPVRVGPS